ncbi:MAG: DEAD/DEAH box helicase [Actinomycetota bacterium]
MSGEHVTVTIAVDGDDVVVTGTDALQTRNSRLFFRSVLGGAMENGGWRCPRRGRPIASVVVRINTFAETQGWPVERIGLADREVERELERRRSFARTRQAAIEWKEDRRGIDRDEVLRTLDQFGWSDQRTLRPHQVDGLLHGLVAGNAANFSVPGSGKTVIALALAATHLAAGTIETGIVVGPLASFRPWEDETAAALGEILRVRRIRGGTRARRQLYGATEPRDLLLLSYATAAADRLALIQLCKTRDVMLIVDESHRIKRFRGGLWAPALIDIGEHARVRLALSGTPMPQSGRDLYSQLNVLWPGRQLTGPPDSFAARVDTQFAGILQDIHPFVARTAKAALGLEPYEVHRHDVEMGPTQAEIYELIANQFRRRLEDADSWTEKLDALRRGRPIRLLQAATNPDLFNRDDRQYQLPRLDKANPTLLDRLANYSRHEVPAKHEAALALVSAIADRGEKVVCWSNFLANLDQFNSLIESRLGIPCYQVDGRVPTDDEPNKDDPTAHRENPDDTDSRERLIARFLLTPGPAALITNPASSSESISLHATCHNAIYLDRTYDCAQFLQSIDRVHRLGLPPGVTVQIHILRATVGGQPAVDHLVDAALRAKESAMLQLLEGADLQPLHLNETPTGDAEGDRQDLEALLRYLLGEETGS